MSAMPFSSNSLYYGDCLEVMQQWDAGCVDLIYLDPPFNSKANYNQTFGKGNGVPAQVRAYTDTWIWGEAAQKRQDRLEQAVSHPARNALQGFRTTLGECGMLAYLSYMGERLPEMKRLLKNTGSIYLHCDYHASHYLKILLDAVFGADNFRNEIVWCYSRMAAGGQKQFTRCFDTIFWYSQGNEWAFNVNDVRLPYAAGSKAREGYAKSNLGGGAPASGKCELNPLGKFPEAWWIDIPFLRGKEKIGYDTQKPLKLLDRIIKASSNKDDVVLDPFCGGGTTLDAANRLGRKWIGIDVSPRAIRLIKERRLKNTSIPTYGIPSDMEGARMMLSRNAFDFEAWAVTLIEGLAPNQRKVGDKGIDGRGRIYDAKSHLSESGLVLAQVKGGNYTAGSLRDFQHVLDREDATAGVFITMRPTRSASALANAARRGSYKMGGTTYPRLQFWSIEEYMRKNRVWPKLPAMADPDTGRAVQGDLLRGDQPQPPGRFSLE